MEYNPPQRKFGLFKRLQQNLILQKTEIDETQEEVQRVEKDAVEPETIQRLDKIDLKLTSIKKMFASITNSLSKIEGYEKNLLELERRKQETDNFRLQENALKYKGVERVKDVSSSNNSNGLSMFGLGSLLALAMFNKLKDYMKEALGKWNHQFKEWVTGQVLTISNQFVALEKSVNQTFSKLSSRFGNWMRDNATKDIRKPVLNTLDKNGRELTGGARIMREAKNAESLQQYQSEIKSAIQENKLIRSTRAISSSGKAIVKYSAKAVAWIGRITQLSRILRAILKLGKWAGAFGKAALVLLTFCDAITAAYDNVEKLSESGKSPIEISDVLASMNQKNVWKEFLGAFAGLFASLAVGYGAAVVGTIIGTLLGNFVPGLGNIIGALLGFLGGLVISWIASGAADFLARELVDMIAGDKTTSQVMNDIKHHVEEFVKDNTVGRIKQKTENAIDNIREYFGIGNKSNKTRTPITKPDMTVRPVNVSDISSTTGDFIIDAANLIQKAEGFPKGGKAYSDPSKENPNAVSIGYGHQITKQETKQGFINIKDKKIPLVGEYGIDTKISKDEAKELLEQDIPRYSEPLKKSLGPSWTKLSSQQKAVLISSAYNTGQGGINVLIKHGLKDAIDSGDFNQAGNIIQKYGIKTNRGQISVALTARRYKEGEEFARNSLSSSVQLAKNNRTPKIDPVIAPKNKVTEPPTVVAQNLIMPPSPKEKSIQNGIPNPGYSSSQEENQSVFYSTL